MRKVNFISIVDDDPITVFGIRKMLNATVECNIVESHINGKLALESIKERIAMSKPLPEIIFLDINMPIMDGWQFLEEFIKLPITKNVKVNIVTSSIDPYDIEQWNFFKSKTKHTITFNNKPIKKLEMVEITRVA
ncbi:two-component system response regulator [Maribacter chungangensis]|uniref:Two-component system response regulator n=1 Tax=Maribacter chungangensis TaxID=1069117 RepID=A0ABW3B4T9_9FLAO